MYQNWHLLSTCNSYTCYKGGNPPVTERSQSLSISDIIKSSYCKSGNLSMFLLMLKLLPDEEHKNSISNFEMHFLVLYEVFDLSPFDYSFKIFLL